MDVLRAQRQRLAKALQNDKKGVFSKIYKSYDKRFFDSFGGLNTLMDFLGLNTKNKITLILQNDKGHFMRVLDYANCELYNEIYSQSDPFRSGNANICIQKTTGRRVLMVSGAYQDAPLFEILGFDYLCFKDEFEFSAGVKFTEALKAYQGKKIIFFDRRVNDATKEILNKELNADVQLVGSYFYEFLKFSANDVKHYQNKLMATLKRMIKE
jgi:hypothetical protein